MSKGWYLPRVFTTTCKNSGTHTFTFNQFGQSTVPCPSQHTILTTGIQSRNGRTSVTSHKRMHKPSNKCEMKTCPHQRVHRFCPMSCREQPMTVQVKMKHKTQLVDCYCSIQLFLHSKTPSCQHKTVKSKRHHKT